MEILSEVEVLPYASKAQMRVRVRRGRGAPSPELSPVCALVWGFLWLSVRFL